MSLVLGDDCYSFMPELTYRHSAGIMAADTYCDRSLLSRCLLLGDSAEVLLYCYDFRNSTTSVFIQNISVVFI